MSLFSNRFTFTFSDILSFSISGRVIKGKNSEKGRKPPHCTIFDSGVFGSVILTG